MVSTDLKGFGDSNTNNPQVRLDHLKEFSLHYKKPEKKGPIDVRMEHMLQVL